MPLVDAWVGVEMRGGAKKLLLCLGLRCGLWEQRTCEFWTGFSTLIQQPLKRLKNTFVHFNSRSFSGNGLGAVPVASTYEEGNRSLAASWNLGKSNWKSSNNEANNLNMKNFPCAFVGEALKAPSDGKRNENSPENCSNPAVAFAPHKTIFMNVQMKITFLSPFTPRPHARQQQQWKIQPER